MHSAKLLPLHREVLGLAAKRVPGIEVRSVETRYEAPWIEVRSTKLFSLNLPLSEDRGAQHRV